MFRLGARRSAVAPASASDLFTQPRSVLWDEDSSRLNHPIDTLSLNFSPFPLKFWLNLCNWPCHPPQNLPKILPKENSLFPESGCRTIILGVCARRRIPMNRRLSQLFLPALLTTAL